MDLQNLMIMKTLKDLKAFSLDKKQMNQIEGGSQYCEHLQQMTRGEEAPVSYTHLTLPTN